MDILVVEDDLHLADVLREILINEECKVEVVNDGHSGLEYASSAIYDVILLDVMLPKMNGFEIVKSLRSRKIATPIILLTAKSEISDRVTGLDCGADDYLTKPFSTEELLARVRAVSRRRGEVIMDEITFSNITLNLTTCMLSSETKSVSLSNKEFQLIKLLLSQPQQIISKDTIIVKVWGYDSDVVDNNVEAYISFLRKKLNYLGANVKINTVRKIGYKIEVMDN